jgi:hypothetical protein
MLDKLRFFCDAEKDRIVFDRRIQKVGCSFNLCMILYVKSLSRGDCCLLVADADSAIYTNCGAIWLKRIASLLR